MQTINTLAPLSTSQTNSFGHQCEIYDTVNFACVTYHYVQYQKVILTTQSARPTLGWESLVWPQSPGYTWQAAPPWCWSVSPASPFSSWSWTFSPSSPQPPVGSGLPGFQACSRGHCTLGDMEKDYLPHKTVSTTQMVLLQLQENG